MEFYICSLFAIVVVYLLLILVVRFAYFDAAVLVNKTILCLHNIFILFTFKIKINLKGSILQILKALNYHHTLL